MHTTQFPGTELKTRGLCSLDAEALLSPLLLCWARGWGGGFPMVTGHSISAIASETGFYCLPLVWAALSLNHLYPENVTWTSQDQKWDGSELTASECSSVLPAINPTHRGSTASSQEEQSRSLAQQQVITDGKLSHGRDIPAAERGWLFCWGLHTRSRIPLLPQ